MTVVWEKSGEGFFAAIQGPDGEPLVNLIVEQFHDDVWDWIVWNPGDTPRQARHGIADTVQEAMRAAEGAARQT